MVPIVFDAITQTIITFLESSTVFTVGCLSKIPSFISAEGLPPKKKVVIGLRLSTSFRFGFALSAALPDYISK